MTDSPPFSHRQIHKLVRRLPLADHSLLAVRQDSPLAQTETLERLAEAIRSTRFQDVLIVVVSDLSDLSVLSEAELNRHGWYRIETLHRLLTRTPTGEKT